MSLSFQPPSPLKTPVLFLVFNRPDTTAQVFEAIRRARPPRLYIAADGPRADRVGERERVAQVRAIATAVDWPCEVKRLFRDENIGCAAAVAGGITWFFEEEERGIILEDDCLPSQSFFWFCEAMLERYEGEARVMAVTGTNITRGIEFSSDYWYSRFALMWGWASWRRAWAQYDATLSEWPMLKRQGWLKELGIDGVFFRRKWEMILDKAMAGDPIDYWDYQWIYTGWRQAALTVAPSVNLVRNLGFSSDATHTIGDDPVRDNLQLHDLRFPLRAPEEMVVSIAADRFIARHWFHASGAAALKTFILKLPGMRAANRFRKRFLRATRAPRRA